MNPPFKVVKNFVPEDHAKFLYEFINIRFEATKHLYKNKLVQPSPIHGFIDDEYDKTPGAYFIYGDPAFDLLMVNQLEGVKSESGEDLIPMNSSARLYLRDHSMDNTGIEKGPENITAAIHLGSEGSSKIWPFYIKSPEGETFQADLGVGDMVVYAGECKTWREPCEHDYYGQVMLHYSKKGSLTKDNKPVKILDGRSNLGLPKFDHY